jgi:hypothetical protein
VKPISIVLSLLLGFSALSLVVWVGRYGGKTNPAKVQDGKPPAPKVEDLPMPASGPFGKAEMAETEFNFGARVVGEKDKHVFTIKNVGKGPLEFKMGEPTCQCTIGEITRENGEVATEGPIAPGESINILVNWVMKDKRERFRQVVPVFTTDPDHRKIEFVITGVVDQLFQINPEGPWELGNISTTGPAKADGYIMSKVLDEFTVNEVPRENSFCKVSFEPVPSEDSQRHGYQSSCVIKVLLDPNIPPGPFREEIPLKVVSAKGEHEIGFVVTARRAGPIEIRGIAGGINCNIETNRLLFGEFPAATGKKGKVSFIVKDFDDELVLKSVSPPDARVKFTFPETGKKFGKSKTYQVEVEVLPGPPVRKQLENADIVTLNFNHPTAPDFKVAIDYSAN